MKTPQNFLAGVAALAISCVAATARADGFSSWFGGGETKQMTPSGSKVDKLGNTVPSPWQKMKSGVSGMGTSVKKKFHRDDKSVADAKKNESDPISLARDAHPSVDFYLSVARMQERSNNVAGAIEQCKRALEVDSKNLAALLALARLYDRQGQLSEATNYYLLAAKHHPLEASVHNDVGLCFARQEKYDEAAKHLRKAIELQPDRVLYRNNLATILVETGKIDQALETLTAVHGQTVAHYNIGFLLNKRGQTVEALEQFQLAATADPSFEAAKQWVEALSGNKRPQTVWTDTKVASQPVETASHEQSTPVRRVQEPVAKASATAPSSATDETQDDGNVALTTRGTRGAALHMPRESAPAEPAAGEPPPTSQSSVSKPVATVAQRERRVPPTPDQIRQYTSDPATGQALVEPLPPVDAQHYPPSRY